MKKSKYPKKIIYVDTETTGLNPQINSAIQIAGVIEIDDEVQETFNFQVRPTEDPKYFSEVALSTHNISVEEMLSYPTAQTVGDQLEELFAKYVNKFDRNDKFVFVGHNSYFDLQFLVKFWNDSGRKGPFIFAYIDSGKLLDTLSTARYLNYKNILKTNDNKNTLESICEAYGIEIEAHDALSDIYATREIFHLFDTLLDNYKKGTQ